MWNVTIPYKLFETKIQVGGRNDVEIWRLQTTNTENFRVREETSRVQLENIVHIRIIYKIYVIQALDTLIWLDVYNSYQQMKQTHKKKQDKYNMYFIDSNNQW